MRASRQRAVRADVLIMLALFIAAIVPRAAWAVCTNRPPRGLHDPSYYMIAGDNIANGTGYSFFYGAKTAIYPVGYPATLAVLKKAGEYLGWGHNVLSVKIMDGTFGAITVLLLYLLARRVFDRRVGVAAGLLLAVFPGQIYFGGAILSDTEFTMLFVAALLVLVWHPWTREGLSHRRLFAAGVLLSAATMVRGILLAFPLVLLIVWIPYLRSTRRAVMQTIIVLAGIGTLVVPWSIRNTLVFHTLSGPSTNLGVDLCIGNAAGAPGQFWFDPRCLIESKGLSSEQAEIRQNNHGVRVAVRDVVTHPLRMPDLVRRKAYFLLRADDEGLTAVQSYDSDVFMSPRRVRVLGLVANTTYYATGVVAVIGALWFALNADRRRRFLLLTMLYVLAIPLVFFGAQQFHFPAIPLLVLVAASTAVGAWDRYRHPRSKADGVPTAGAGASSL